MCTFASSGLFLFAVFIILCVASMPISYIGRLWSYQTIKGTNDIPPYLYTRNTIAAAFGCSVILIYLVIILLSLVYIVLKDRFKRINGVLVILIICLANILMSHEGSSIKWLLPLTNANYAEHFKMIYVGKTFPVWYSFLYYLFFISILVYITISHRNARKENKK